MCHLISKSIINKYFYNYVKLFHKDKLNYAFSSKLKHYSTSPLEGIRVLDMSRILAGPFATMILGDLGAEVIKIEKPNGGDDTRKWGPPFLNGESCYFFSINRNKRSVVIDLKRPEGSCLVRQLAQKSDILVENFVPGVLQRYGLDFKSLNPIAPRLIYCSLTGYGSTGPYSKRPGFDVLAASMGGLLSVTGPKDGDPCKVGVAMTDLAAGLYIHGAAMAALLQRSKTNKGQLIECDLLSTQVACMVNLASNYLNAGHVAQRRGTSHESIVPYEAFRTKDGFITIGAGNEGQFQSLCQKLQQPSLANNPFYLSNALRVQNRTSLIKILKEKFVEKSTSEWLEVFEGATFTYAPINNLDEVFCDQQVLHQNMVQSVDHCTVGTVKLVAPPVRYSNSHNAIRSAPPTLGQHTSQVLREVLHMSQKEIDNLKNVKIIECN